MFARVSALSLLAFALGLAEASAGSERLFVSREGSDESECTNLKPCRTFAHAASVAALGGEIDVLTPGGYGAVTIDKALSIVNDSGGVAAITTSGGPGVLVVAGANDAVYLRGLTIKDGRPPPVAFAANAVGGADRAALASAAGGLRALASKGAVPLVSSGVEFLSGASLRILDCDVHDYLTGNSAILEGYGIAIGSSTNADISIINTKMSNNFTGIAVAPLISVAVTAMVDRSTINDNYVGILGENFPPGTLNIEVIEDVVSGNRFGLGFLGEVQGFGEAAVKNSNISGNVIGLEAAGGTFRLSGSMFHDNKSGYVIVPPGIIYSYGDNVIDDNGPNFGALTPAKMQ